MTAVASFQNDVTASITKIESIETTAVGPGEVAGPGVAVTVEIENGTTEPISLDSVFVTVLGTDKSPALPTTGDPASPMSGELAPGARASGVYVFTLPEALRSSASVAVSYTTEAPVVLFTGKLA